MASAIVGALRVMLELNASQLEGEFAKATVKIGDFDKFTQNAGRNLQRMVEQFSGQKIVAEAAKMAAAVEKVGGVSALTERELKRVTATVGEATAKLRAMGAEVPPSIAKIDTELKALAQTTDKAGAGAGMLGTAWRAVGPLLPVASVIGLTTAVISLGKQAFESAGDIIDLANKTGLSTDAIQEMQAVANQTGTSLDAFTNASFKLGVNIAEGTTKARDAVNALGLSYTDLKNQKPEDQFMTVIRALEGVDNQQERNRLGVALFGRQFAEIAASIEDGYSRIADAASKSSREQLDALDVASDAWTKFVDDASKEVQRFLGQTVLMAQAVTSGFAGFTDKQREELALRMGAGEDITAIVDEFKKLNTVKKEVATTTQDLIKWERDFVGEIEDARDRISNLTDSELKELNAALRIGGDTAKEYAESIGLNELALKLFQQESKNSSKDLKEQQRELEKAAAAQKKFNDQISDFAKLNTALHTALQQGWFGKIETELKDNFTLIAAVGDEMGKADQAAERWAFTNGAVLMPSVKASGVAIETATKKTIDWGKQLGTLAQAFAQLAQIAGEGGLGQALQSIGNIVGVMNLAHTAGKNLSDGLKDIAEHGGSVADKFGLIAANTATYVSAMAQMSQTTNQAEAALNGFATTAAFASGLGASAAAATGFGIAGALVLWGIAIDRSRDQWRAMRAAMEVEIGRINKAMSDLVPTTQDIGAAFAALGLDINSAFSPDLETRLKNTLELYNEFKKRLDSANKAFGPLLQNAEALGQRLPQSILDALEKYERLGILSEANVASLHRLRDAGEFDLAQVEAAAGRLGIRFSELGPKLRGAKVTETARSIVNDMQLIIDAGGDVGGALFESRQHFSDLVNESRRTGTALPQNMQPWIEELARAGLLTNEAGEKMLSLEGVSFGPRIKTQWEMATEALEKQLEVLERIAEAIENMPVPNYGQPPPVPGAPPPGGTQPPAGGPPDQGDGRQTGTFGATGRWFENFGSGKQITAHGWESVVPIEQAVPFAVSVLKSAGLGQFTSGGLLPKRPSLDMPRPGDWFPIPKVPLPPTLTLPDPEWSTPGMPIGRLDDIGDRSGSGLADDMIRVLEDLRGDFRSFTDEMPIVLRDAVRGAV